MSLKARITEDMKAAMKARQSARLSAIRLLLAAIKQREVDDRQELADPDVLAVIEKMLKQRRDSIAQYEAASRQDLADTEKFEVGVLSAYMPQQLSDEEIAAEVRAVVAAVGASGLADMGKVMGPVKARLAGRADMANVSAQVKALLAG
ncbi:MAG: GatB/YqeY domain-containing protein [Betaproteobacteria bacterium]|nr:GatB/YqeY domain-containing protein [Betaproteobacteria bacterium]